MVSASPPSPGTLARAHVGLIAGRPGGLPDTRPAYEPSPQVKPVMHSPSEAKGTYVPFSFAPPLGTTTATLVRRCTRSTSEASAYRRRSQP